MHEYLFRIDAVHDGDTFSGYLDLGFYLGMSVSVRVHGINAPELTVTVDGHRSLNQAGEDATQHLLGLFGRSRFAETRLKSTFGIPGDYLALPGQQPYVVARTRIKDGDGDYEKYGRVLAEVYLGTSDDPLGLDVGLQMLADGFAVLD